MDESKIFDYLLQMGAMRPEEDELSRKQAMVDALRQQSMKPMQGQMAGNVYVAPSITQGLAQLGQAYGARKGQQGVDTDTRDLNARQRSLLDALRAASGMSKKPEKEDEVIEGFTASSYYR